MASITEETWMEYLEGSLPPQEMESLRDRIANEPAVAAQWEDIYSTWQLMDSASNIPEPSPDMDQGFEAMLAEHTPKANPWKSKLEAWLGTWVVPRWAIGAFILLIGFGLGRYLGPGQQNDTQLTALTQEMQDMRQMMMLTLLEQPTAQDRMRAVSMTNTLPQADAKIIEALVQTLHTDDNVNVRLVAVEALAQYAEHPIARMGLIEAIEKQNSPMVQIALAEVMLRLKDSQAVPAFQKLLEKPRLDTTVQEVVNETIQQLI